MNRYVKNFLIFSLMFGVYKAIFDGLLDGIIYGILFGVIMSAMLTITFDKLHKVFDKKNKWHIESRQGDMLTAPK